MRDIDEIIIHCTATPPAQDLDADQIRTMHREENGWSDIGYHVVIRRDGTAENGRPISRPGAHVRGRNQKSIGIALVGGVDASMKPDCNFTAAQWGTMEAVVQRFLDHFHLTPLAVSGHREHNSSKACPCFDVRQWAKTLEA